MKNDTLPATDYLKVFNREQEPPPVPPRQHQVHLPTVVIHIAGGVLQSVYADWPVRVILCDSDDASEMHSAGGVLETEEIGTVDVREQSVETDRKAQRLVAEITHFAEREDTLPLPEGSALSQ